MNYLWAALITLWLVVAVYFYINYVIFHKYFGKAGRKNKVIKKSEANPDYERINITAADDVVLTSKLFTPENCDGTKSVLLCHGYKSDGETDFQKEISFYKNLGFNVLVIEQRCHSKSAGDIISMGLTESYDTVYWCKWLELRFGTGCPVIIHGKGMGGFAAIVALSNSELPSNVKKAVVDSVYDNIYNVFSKKFTESYGFWSKLIIPTVNMFYRMNTGFDMRDGDIKKFAKKVRVPVLFLNTDKTAEAFTFTKTAVSEVDIKAFTE